MMRRRSVVAGGYPLNKAREKSRASVSSRPLTNERTRIIAAFKEGLRGYVEGRNIILEFCFGGGDLTHGPKLAAELPVDVIVVEGLAPTRWPRPIAFRSSPQH
jgi:hypothetical protein